MKQQIIGFVTDHKAEIGVCGLVTASVLTARQTIKAVALVEDEKIRSQKPKLNWKETAKTTWKCYVAPAALAACSAYLILVDKNKLKKSNAALAATSSIAQKAYTNLREATEKTLTEKQKEKVDNEVAEQVYYETTDAPQSASDIIVGDGPTVCCDSITGRYFRSDMQTIQAAASEMNSRLISDCQVTLNDFLYELGLEETSLGDLIGWDIDKGSFKIRFGSKLMEDNTPVLVILYDDAVRTLV